MKRSKALDIIIGISTIILGAAMTVLAWYFFFEEEDGIVSLASLYVCIIISVVICVLGICLVIRANNKGENIDEK